jgi:hypothetical protein
MKGTQKLAAVLTILVLAFGFLPLFAQPLPYKEMDWLALEPTIYYADDYEPDDTRNLARPFPANDPLQFHNFHVTGDEDWIWFYAQVGTSYAIETRARPLGSLADTVLELYNLAGALLARDDDGGPMTDALLVFDATYTGIHYARVTEWADRYGDAYWYYLRVVEVQHRVYLPIVMRGAP